MPRVVSGTSAGGALAALLCTRKDEELRELLTPDLALRLTAFEEPFSVWGKRVWTTGARFDRVHWARKVFRSSFTSSRLFLITP
jgi:predicted acylesterase/phospholipase RssA